VVGAVAILGNTAVHAGLRQACCAAAAAAAGPWASARVASRMPVAPTALMANVAASNADVPGPADRDNVDSLGLDIQSVVNKHPKQKYARPKAKHHP